MPSQTADAQRRTTQNEPSDLDSRYGRIGIPAVAAAARYPSDARNLAYAPAPMAEREHEDAVT